MPTEIEKLVRCSDVKLTGVVGPVVSALTDIDILSMLPLDAVTGILPSGLLGDVLGKGDAAKPKGNADAPDALALQATDTEAVASPVSSFLPGAAAASPSPAAELTEQVSSKVNDIPGPGPLKGVLSNGVPGVTSKLTGITDTVGGLLKSAGGKNLGNVVSKVKDLSKTSTDLVSNALASESSTGASGGKEGLDVSGLLLK